MLGAQLIPNLASPLLPQSSPDKEAFKKRAKLQQDNSEETDENEAEEVRPHPLLTAHSPPASSTLLRCPVWPCASGGGVGLHLLGPWPS